MEIPSSFRGKKRGTDEKLEDLLKRTEKDLPGGLNEEMIDKVCKYLDVPSYSFFYRQERDQITKEVEQFNNRDYRALRALNDRIDKFEKTLKKTDIEWKLLSDKYTREAYKKHGKKLAKIIARSPVIGYSTLINYLPAKVSGYLIEKGESQASLFPSGLQFLGAFSYLALMAGEIAAVGLTTKFGGVFFLSYFLTGFFHAIWGSDYNWDNFEYYLGLIKDYKKIRKNQKLIDYLREEKEDIIHSIKDNIQFEKMKFYRP